MESSRERQHGSRYGPIHFPFGRPRLHADARAFRTEAFLAALNATRTPTWPPSSPTLHLEHVRSHMDRPRDMHEPTPTRRSRRPRVEAVSWTHVIILPPRATCRTGATRGATPTLTTREQSCPTRPCP